LALQTRSISCKICCGRDVEEHFGICWTKEDNLYNCFLLEQKLLEENKEFLYQPTNLTIGGKTECISKEIINDF